MTSAELDALVTMLREQTPLKRLSPDASRMVFLAMISIGYDFIKPEPGDRRTFLESDLELHELRQWLRDVTALGSLSYPESKAVFDSLGLKIQRPTKHPSGIRCTEQPYTRVSKIGAGSNYRVVDKQGLPAGPIAIYNGGECD